MKEIPQSKLNELKNKVPWKVCPDSQHLFSPWIEWSVTIPGRKSKKGQGAELPPLDYCVICGLELPSAFKTTEDITISRQEWEKLSPLDQENLSSVEYVIKPTEGIENKLG